MTSINGHYGDTRKSLKSGFSTATLSESEGEIALRVTARVVEIKRNSICSTISVALLMIRHVKVKGTASPDDPSLRDYWLKRNLKIGKHKWAKGSKYEQVAKIQNHQCPVCGNSNIKFQHHAE
jgi:hypothetical protein